jgi:serine/threonine protein kinase
LAHWLYGRAIFGASDKIIEDHTEAWCIAKLQRLVGTLGPCIDRQPYKNEFELAEQLASMEIGPGLGKLIKVGTLRQELQSLSDPSVSTQLLDFIDYLLVIDMAKRPTAADALQHPYLQSD